ncbi:MAG: ribonuclease HI [Gemmatimonadota bacterium]|nr:ribonuclease HI [Gemmatimonadota bacterium]
MSTRPHTTVISVYADESCLGNGREGSNPGGAGGLIQCFLPSKPAAVQRDYWISERATTNNRMALRSAIEAFRLLSSKGKSLEVYFTSDSNYLVQGMTSWTKDWVRRGWKRKGGVLENLELWQELVDEASAHQHHWRWVKGHNSHPQNEYANHLATRAARELTSSSGAEPSGFDEWLDAQRARGKMKMPADERPDPARFKEGCALRDIEEDSPHW